MSVFVTTQAKGHPCHCKARGTLYTYRVTVFGINTQASPGFLRQVISKFVSLAFFFQDGSLKVFMMYMLIYYNHWLKAIKQFAPGIEFMYQSRLSSLPSYREQEIMQGPGVSTPPCSGCDSLRLTQPKEYAVVPNKNLEPACP
jgi:hypothetical protein